jgi:hypothetical protein
LQSATSFIGDSGSGQSYTARLAQTRVAWDAFASAPIFGVGPGWTYQWQDRFGVYSSFSIDSPAAIPAKFGIVGLVAMAAIVVALIVLTRNLRVQREPSTAWTALVAFLAVVAAGAPLGSPFEDKGLGFGLLILIALAVLDSSGSKEHENHNNAEVSAIVATRINTHAII